MEIGWLYYGARMYDPAYGRFTGIDPLASDMASWSPYCYTFNNPIRYTDPTGMAPENVIITGSQAEKATQELNKSSSLEITRNSETGLLSATGQVKSESDRILLAAIGDSQVTVRLETTDAQIFDSKDGTKNIPLLPGGFEGSISNSDATKVTATQLLNVKNAEIISGVIGEETGETIRHEINEAYYGAIQNPGGDYDTAYEAAHSAIAKTDRITHPKLQVNEVRSQNPPLLQIRKAGTQEWKTLGPKTKLQQ